jgi:Lhr-like helicase
VADSELVIEFPEISPADATRLAQDLEQQLREAVPSVKTSLVKTRPDSQDFGTTLVLLFGTPVAIALAKAVTVFLQRNTGATIIIKTKSGSVIGENLDSGDAAKITEAFSSKDS